MENAPITQGNYSQSLQESASLDNLALELDDLLSEFYYFQEKRFSLEDKLSVAGKKGEYQ